MSDLHAHSVSFVRDTMLPQATPPITERGAIKWMRENLFSGWFNSILTIVSIYVIYVILSHILPWFVNSIWVADSLDECRQIRDAVNGGEPSACFAVITERWQQLIYGFYPVDRSWGADASFLFLYIRPNIAFALLFVAIAPILYDKLPRKMLWFSALYPFLAFWLVWGGSVWMPVSVLAGLVLAFVAFQLLGSVSGLVAALGAFLMPLIWWYFLAAPVADAIQSILPVSLDPVDSKKIGGFMISIIIGLAGIVLSLPIGVVLALGRQSDLLIVKMICVGFIEFIRGVPLITLLFTASLLLNYFLPPGTNFDIVLRVIIMVTLFASAYMAETIRGGLAALPKGQYEAADSLGLDYWKSQRLIIMPQALKISIPGIVNNFIGLFKDTTLVLFIGIFDMLGLVGAIRASTEWNGVYFELFIFVAAVFWICCFSMSRYSQWLERKLQTEHR